MPCTRSLPSDGNLVAHKGELKQRPDRTLDGSDAQTRTTAENLLREYQQNFCGKRFKLKYYGGESYGNQPLNKQKEEMKHEAYLLYVIRTRSNIDAKDSAVLL